MSALLSEITRGGKVEAAAAAASSTTSTITTKNVHQISTYDLRQELVRRNCLDIPDAQINHNSMLQRLIQALIIEEANATEVHTAAVVDKAQEERDAAKALREQRKAEALARSKERQADPDYFRTRQEQNKVKEVAVEPSAAAEEEEPAEDGTNSDDPFRTYKSKSRAKIAGFI